MSQWLIRTAQNRFQGPMPQEELVELIQSGKLGLQDEVCAENHYWFYLHESEELKSQLGVVLPRRQKKLDDEDTQTQTQTETQTQTVTEPIYYQSAPRVEGAIGGVAPEAASTDRREGVYDPDHTVVQRFELQVGPGSTAGVTEIQVRGPAEREIAPLIWKLVSALLGLIVVGLAGYLWVWMKG